MKNAEYIAKLICEKIEQIGVENVVVNIMDNTSANRNANRIIEQRFPTVAAIGCSAHVMDLLMEDFGKFPAVKEVVDASKKVVKYIRDHHSTLASFRTKSAELSGGLELVLPGDTRFATAYICMARMEKVKKALEAVVLDEDFNNFMQRQRVSDQRAKAVELRQRILDIQFWSKVRGILKLFEKPWIAIRAFDSDAPSLSKVYKLWNDMMLHMRFAAEDIQHLEIVDPDIVAGTVRNRWDFIKHDVHALGYALDPENWDVDPLGNAEVSEGFHRMLERIYGDDTATHDKVIDQYAKYANKQGIFAVAAVQRKAKDMSATQWWRQFGGTTPELRGLATKITAQVGASSASERNWSTYDFVHNKRRNRLHPDRANDLVYVHSGLRLWDRIADFDFEIERFEWDILDLSASERRNADDDDEMASYLDF